MIDDLVADAALEQQTGMILRQDFIFPQGTQQFGKGVFGYSLEWTGRDAKKSERLSGLEAAILRDGGQ